MAEVMNMPVESLDTRRPSKEKPSDEHHRSDDNNKSSPSPPRRRDRDSRERRDDRDFDRRPHPPRYYDHIHRRGGRDYNNNNYNNKRNSSPPPQHYRGRDYHRRNNFSPPSRRSSPPHHPPFKRSRRDDGGYDGQRGSPRGGGYRGGDRRFGYDYPGGYDREIGGRSGYADDRPHGRFRSGGFPGGPSDWEAGRGGYTDASTAGNAQRTFSREGLMTYKQFIQELEDDVLPGEAERRYQEYKSEYISTQKRTYFEAHKDEEWLRDKYHPTNLLNVIERRNEFARKVAKDFLLDLHSGSLDMGPGANALSINKSGQTSEPNSEDEADVGGKRRRHGRVQAKDSDMSAATKAHPVSSDPRRIQIDVELAQALVTKLDSEKGIEDNILSKDDTDKMNRERSHSGSIGPVIIIRGLTSVKGLEGVELLDTLVTYLWRVHGVDYYGTIEIAEPKGLRHVRAEGKSSDASSNAVEWEKKVDSYWQNRMQTQDPLEVMTAKEKIDAAAVEALDPFVRKIRDEKYGWKYGCGAKGCTKLFHAAEYVHKHLKLKHVELVMELTSKVREDLYFQNYMNDPNAPGGQPVMQQFVPTDKLQRRRAGTENRLKDERGNRRERDWNGVERFENQENPQADLPPSNNNDADKGNPEEPNFENFGGQGVHVAPFAPDIAPPPVLMPVPGAGPLGPFVPAPPEVAMRMLREQPTPFEGPGRNVRAAPPLILPPSFRQDPRHLRSYHDLDAPDDEVTVIDYRSL
ncbi:serrate RNA effector molecule-like [Amaranthus tricolor]|uniref:serrate RNA effector molecule-like n=1 Tax=Amaranthus tricolor TaxID=29722 RepID=UPI002590F781|nr:serrate RNA effector molecule-like [Amaranthus tricolor]